MKFLEIAKEFAEELKEKKDVLAALVIGSVARGTANESSDIDLLIITTKKLKVDTKDNIETREYNGKKLQLLYASFEEIKKDIKKGYAFRIDQLRHAIVLFDKTGKAKELIKEAREFKFQVDIKKRIEQAEEGLEKFEKLCQSNEFAAAKLASILYPFWLGRDIIEFNNSASTSIRDFPNELGKFDPKFLKLFETLIGKASKEELKKTKENFQKLIKHAKEKYFFKERQLTKVN